MRVTDEDAVRATEDAYNLAWGNGDLDGLLACLTPDAVLVSPRGDVAVGEHEIRQLLGAFLSTEAQGSEHRSIVDRINFIGNDVAVLDARAVISGDGGLLIEHAFTDILVRREGRWLIAHIRAYHFDPDI